jgi:hypothetical protein
MITNVLNMLRMSHHYGISENVEIAKGKYKIPTTVKEVFNQAIRERKMKKALKDGRI